MVVTKVSIMSLTDSCCVVWNRQLLDCLLAKDAFTSAVMTQLIGRDVTNKLYASMQVTYLLTYCSFQLIVSVLSSHRRSLNIQCYY